MTDDADVFTDIDRSFRYRLIEELRERYAAARPRCGSGKTGETSYPEGERSNLEGERSNSVGERGKLPRERDNSGSHADYLAGEGRISRHDRGFL